jgi:hypothetical protein
MQETIPLLEKDSLLFQNFFHANVFFIQDFKQKFICSKKQSFF